MSVEVQLTSATPNSGKHPRLSASDGVHFPAASDNSSKRQQPISLAELHDSCYSSSSEGSHSSLSREPSNGIVKEMEQLSMTDTESVVIDPGNNQQNILLRNIDFATRLGYSVKQLETVLAKLGTNAGQDQILGELVKLGRGAMDRGSKVVGNRLADPASPQLRSIVIDGSNIAMTHGRKELFSCRGILECVQFFRNRGHTDIIVFVPQFRREAPRSDSPITDQHILFELESENVLVWTPSRRINGRRIVCHDDRYILKTAEDKDAVIVSNDEYRDLIKENPQYRTLVDERLLMYSFVDGRFMPPDDPLGRHGPTLAQFLTKGSRPSLSQHCPYARKCTYGNKCKYYHPERPNGIHVSVTERLMKERQQKQFLSACASQPMVTSQGRMDHSAVFRTQSLNIPTRERTKIASDDKKLANPHHQDQTQPLSSPAQARLSDPTVQRMAVPSLQNLSSSRGRARTTRLAHTNRLPQAMNPQSCLPPSPPTGCNSSPVDHSHYYYPIYVPYPYISAPYLNGSEPRPDLCQASSFYVPNPDFMSGVYGAQTAKTSYLVSSSAAVWSGSKVNVEPTMRSLSEPSSPMVINERHRLQNILCQLFPERIVLSVMEEFPDKSDPQELCSRILERM